MEFSLYLSSKSIIRDMEFINLAHCVYTCDYHIVLVTRYRRKVFNEGIFAHFEKELAGITEHYPLIRIKTMAGSPVSDGRTKRGR